MAGKEREKTEMESERGKRQSMDVHFILTKGKKRALLFRASQLLLVLFGRIRNRQEP